MGAGVGGTREPSRERSSSRERRSARQVERDGQAPTRRYTVPATPGGTEMIVEVLMGEERQPRRYELRRQGSSFNVRRLTDASGEDNPGETVIDWRRPEPGIYSLLVDDSSYEVFIDEEGEYFSVHLLNRTFKIRAADARRRRATVAAEITDGVARIIAPIPGRVAKVLQPPGSLVQRGDGIIVLEAMKMENELRAPRDGTVASMEVEEGEGVEGGALLATIE